MLGGTASGEKLSTLCADRFQLSMDPTIPFSHPRSTVHCSQRDTTALSVTRARKCPLWINGVCSQLAQPARSHPPSAHSRYPKEIWGNYVDTLETLGDSSNRDKARECLNEMVIDALGHIPDVFAYMAEIKNQTVFNFCAIPQVMAIATLALLYDNGEVFEGVVKIRKGESQARSPRFQSSCLGRGGRVHSLWSDLAPVGFNV